MVGSKNRRYQAEWKKITADWTLKNIDINVKVPKTPSLRKLNKYHRKIFEIWKEFEKFDAPDLGHITLKANGNEFEWYAGVLGQETSKALGLKTVIERNRDIRKSLVTVDANGKKYVNAEWNTSIALRVFFTKRYLTGEQYARLIKIMKYKKKGPPANVVLFDCSKCGAPIKAKERFCNGCGVPLL